jgi:hypothetical protein
MEFRVHRKLRDQIENERRDIALVTLPGMGLSTLLKSLEEVNRLPIAWLDIGTITRYWLQVRWTPLSRHQKYYL